MNENMCKLCLQQTFSQFSLNERIIGSMLRSCIPKLFRQNIQDGKICIKCLLNLKLAYKFQQQVIKSLAHKKPIPGPSSSKSEKIVLNQNKKRARNCSVTLEFSTSNERYPKVERCLICGNVLSANRFFEHVNEHYNEKQRCSICIEEFSDVDLLRKHFEHSAHNKQLFQCINCGHTFQYKSIFDIHSKTVCCMNDVNLPEDKLISCDKKKMIKLHFKSLTRMKKKIAQKMGTSLENSENNMQKEVKANPIVKKETDIVPVEIEAKPVVKQETVEDEVANEFNKVEQSGQQFFIKIETHENDLNSEENKDPDFKKTCEFCETNFTSQMRYNFHLLEIQRCRICSDLVMKCCYRLHIQLHKERHKMCHICGLSCKNLTQHIWDNHRDKKKLQCDCPKTFTNSHRFKMHMLREHGGKRSLVCESCGKAFFTKTNLKRHVNFKHLKLREHICKFCQKAFSTKYAMNTHTRLHTNELPFRCEVCGCGYPAKISLTNHLRSKHGIEDEITCHCKECGKGFPTPVSLYAHMRIHL